MYEFSVAMIESEKVEIILQITKNYPLVEDKRKSELEHYSDGASLPSLKLHFIKQLSGF